MTDQPGNNGQIDYKERTFTTKRGEVLPLKEISFIALRNLQRDFWGMPQPPVTTVEVGPKKQKTKVTNPDDPEYKKRLAEWTNAKNERLLMYTWVNGVDREPSEEEVTRLRQYLPNATPEMIKYTWIAELLDNDEEVGLLSQAITSQTEATEQGISDAESTFPGDGERDNGHQAVHTTESADQDNG